MHTELLSSVTIFHTTKMEIWIALTIFGLCAISVQSRSFTIDYNRDTFLKDGQPFRYVSGNMHYFQIPRELWRDRMLRVRALGCNALQTYVMWSRHEPEENRYNFAGDANLTEYLSLAQELGFVVTLRLGPYIDAEMDFGGFPYWLLKNKDLALRSSKDDRYLKSVETWMTYLTKNIVKPLLYNNGGPVITVQIENEYGFVEDCDQKYLAWMRDLVRKQLGNDVVLYTTDNIVDEKSLPCGNVEGALATIDFGPVKKAVTDDKFAKLRKYMPKGPMVNSEFYPAWLDHWGDAKHFTTPTADVLDTMTAMWDWNVTSFSIYPVHGGTNWGYQAGSLSGPPFNGITTEYDFDAPISEAGDTTSKYVAMRELIQKLLQKQSQDPIPESPQKYAYGRVRMERLGTVLDLIHTLTPPQRIVNSTYPLTMEEVDQAYGFVLYEATIPKDFGILVIRKVYDRAYVMIDGEFITVVQRNGKQNNPTVIDIQKIRKSKSLAETSVLQILIENQGRIAFGPALYDPKGMLGNVTVKGDVVTDWTIYPIDLGRIHALDSTKLQESIKINGENSNNAPKYIPSIYLGHFFADPKPGDTFFDPSGWGKGQLYVNGHNIGRYWPQAGPQITLYVPGVYLNDDYNQIYTLELDQPGWCETGEKSGCYVEFTHLPKFTAQ